MLLKHYHSYIGVIGVRYLKLNCYEIYTRRYLVYHLCYKCSLVYGGLLLCY
jgi:hypothetical protein